MVVCQWKRCGIFRYLVPAHTRQPEETREERKKKNREKT